MAQVKKERKSKQEQDLIPLKYQHIAAVFAIFISLIIFFHDVVFDGKVFVSGDTIAGQSFKTLLDDAEKEGVAPLWNPYIFCGMPGVASMSMSGSRSYDITAFVYGKIYSTIGMMLNKEIGYEMFFYFVFGCGMYWFAYSKLQSKTIALIVALGTLYSMFIIIWIMVGHVTKIAVMAFFPYIFLGVEKLREKFDLKIAVLLTVCVHFFSQPSHVQMIFYTYFALGIYYLFFLIRSIIKKENWQGVIRSAAIFAVASILAFAMNADQYFSTLEYSKYSIRGASPIQNQQANATNQGKVKEESNGGLDYEYATNWSFSPGEALTFIVPSLYGFGQFDYQGPLTQNQKVRLNTYFGQQTFTDAPQYMGIVILAFAIFGFVRNRKDPFVQFLGIVTIIALLISFGREFSLIYDVMFYYFPMFNKFRIPSMILVLVQIFVPLLAGYGLVSIVADGTKNLSITTLNRWKFAAAGLGALLILSFAAKSMFASIYESFFPQQEVMKALSRSYGNLQPAVQTEFYKVITDMVTNDIAIAFFVLTVVAGAVYLFLSRTIKFSSFFTILVCAVMFDLWRIDFKPMETHNPQQVQQENFVVPEYVKFLQQDTTVYRTLEFVNGQPPYSNKLAYWKIQSAYGYQGVKMRAYQDIVENVGMGNPLMWGLMNVKYIISNTRDSNSIMMPVYQGNENIIYYNRAELPRAFFVNRYETASGLEILQKIKAMSFNPRDVAYGMENPNIKIDSVKVGAEIQYTKFDLMNLELHAKATGNNLLFLSEAYYPEGWKAFIDGNETPIYRLNYLFRGLVVPVGEHTIAMKFEPRGFYLGKQLSLWINILLLAGIGYFGVMYFVKAKNKNLES